MKYFSVLFLFLCSMFCFSQEDDTVLDTIFLKAESLKDKSVGQPVIHLDKATLSNYRPQLTEVLQFETPVYFKENGFGMVTSPSFRGTTAQQTAVVWNGININSAFLGQTDFSLVNTQNFSNVSVRPGGGSSQYGTGAIGGVIYLNNNLEVDQGTIHEIRTSFGSFNTKNISSNHNISGEKTHLQIGVSYVDSDNDYKYPNTDKHNENGQFYNLNATVNGLYQLNKNNTFKIYSNWTFSDRHFSIIEASQTRNKYTDDNLRLLGEYQHKSGRNQSTVKVALINENYRFYPEIDSREGSTNGVGWTYIANVNHQLQYRKVLLNFGAEYNLSTANGSNFNNIKRNNGSINAFLKHQLAKNFIYQATLRGELNEGYKSPILFSLGTSWQPVPEYALKTSISKNYRTPTFNDLYWPGLENPDLKAESSMQYEVSNEFTFDQLTFGLTGYYNDIQDLIRWLPYSGDRWQPINTNSVKSYGLESNVNYGFQWAKHHMNIKALYSYTVSKNTETDYQLIYVPYHKATLGFSYQHNAISARLNTVYTGEVFTHSDNNPDEILDDFLVTNLSANYTFGTTTAWTVGAGINNLFNNDYKTMAYRPMPGINYQINLTLKL